MVFTLEELKETETHFYFCLHFMKYIQKQKHQQGFFVFTICIKVIIKIKPLNSKSLSIFSHYFLDSKKQVLEVDVKYCTDF